MTSTLASPPPPEMADVAKDPPLPTSLLPDSAQPIALVPRRPIVRPPTPPTNHTKRVRSGACVALRRRACARRGASELERERDRMEKLPAGRRRPSHPSLASPSL